MSCNVSIATLLRIYWSIKWLCIPWSLKYGITLLMYHSGTNLGFYIIYENMPITYLALGLFGMNVLTLWSFDTETKVVIVAFLWYPLSVVCLRLLLLFIACVLLAHVVWLRILTILHSLIHSIELHLVVIVIIVASSSIVVITVFHIEVLVRTLSHYLLR